MSEQESEHFPAEPPSEMLPAGTEALFVDLVEGNRAACTDDEFDLLALMVDEALCGVDLPERYPTFWRKMMVNAELYEAFVDCLQLLEADRAGRLRPWLADDVDTADGGEQPTPPAEV
jgi:hypothetical protein